MALTDWSVESIGAIRSKTQNEWRLMTSSNALRLDLQTFVNRNRRPPGCLQFVHLHPLFCIGEHHDVSLWNWKSGQYVGSFPNGSASSRSSKLSDLDRLSTLQIVNPLTHGFLLTGTDLGDVRIFDCNIVIDFDAYNSSQSHVVTSSINGQAFGSGRLQPKLVTAWTPAHDVLRFGGFPTAGRARTEYFWEQDSALLFVGGDFKTLRVWDAKRELKVQEFAITTDQGTVTSISADYHGHSLVAIGTIDGDVRVYDRRIPPDENRIMKFRDLDKPIVKVHLQRRAVGSQLVAGSEDGKVRVWDPRMYQDPVVACQVDDGSSVSSMYGDWRVSAMDVHEEYDLMALATAHTHAVHLLSFSGRTLNTIRYHDGYMGQKLSDIRCLKFHPYLLSLGLGSADNVIAMYSVSS